MSIKKIIWFIFGSLEFLVAGYHFAIAFYDYPDYQGPLALAFILSMAGIMSFKECREC